MWLMNKPGEAPIRENDIVLCAETGALADRRHARSVWTYTLGWQPTKPARAYYLKGHGPAYDVKVVLPDERTKFYRIGKVRYNPLTGDPKPRLCYEVTEKGKEKHA